MPKDNVENLNETAESGQVQPIVMQNSMIIDQHSNKKEHHICPCRDCKGEGGIIPTFYSNKHADAEGWKMTAHINFCDPDKEYVWVCPKCASAFNWTVA